MGVSLQYSESETSSPMGFEWADTALELGATGATVPSTFITPTATAACGVLAWVTLCAKRVKYKISSISYHGARSLLWSPF